MRIKKTQTKDRQDRFLTNQPRDFDLDWRYLKCTNPTRRQLY